MSEVYKILGLLGSFVVVASFMPQIRKVYQTKSAADISYRFQILYLVGLVMIIIYGIGESLWPIYIPCSMELVAIVVLLIMKYYYDGNDVQQPTAQSENALESKHPSFPSSKDYSLVISPNLNQLDD